MPEDILRIPLDPVDSSVIGARGYDLVKRVLAMQVGRAGRVYHYYNVPAPLAQQFFEAESAGTFYGAHIKGQYNGRRVTGPCPRCGAEGYIGAQCEDCGCAAHLEVTKRRIHE